MLIRPPEFIKKMYPNLLWELVPEGNELYLTFDDGPCPSTTLWILDQLDRYGAKATFFCIAKNVEMYPDLYREILRRGHAVGNHSYSHVKGWGMSVSDYLNDVDMAAGLIHSNLYRPPYARITPSQARMIVERYNIVMWSVLSRDYSRHINGRQCVKNVVPYLKPGVVIVFHDSVKCSRNMKYALPRVLEAIYGNGLKSERIEL